MVSLLRLPSLLLVLAVLRVGESRYKRTRVGDHRIKTAPNVTLQAYSVAPIATGPKQFPLLLFINSWATDASTEYTAVTNAWAEQGYIIVTYAARGWYLSGGEVDVAGPDNCQDASAVINWALKEFPAANNSAIGMVGISYGAVISQLTAASDPRVRAVAALSGTSNAMSDLYWQHSVAVAWGDLLVDSAKLPFVGREAPSVSSVWNDLLHHQNIAGVVAWAANRSMDSMFDKIQANQPAVYISHNHDDNLFHSDVELEAYERLKCPKKMDLSQGTHASAEAFGLLPKPLGPLPSMAAKHIWGNALRWLDHYLKGVFNMVDTEPPVQMQVGGDGMMSPYVVFESWPPPATVLQYQELYLAPRAGADFAALRPAPPSLPSTTDNVSWYKDYIVGQEMHGMNTGFFGVDDIFKTLKPIAAQLGKVNRSFGVVYKGLPVRSPANSLPRGKTQICGIPRLTGVEVVPSGREFQLVAFLYDMDPRTSEGRLISHGTRTVWAEEGAVVGQRFKMEQISFHSCCYEVPFGHHVALGLSMQDGLYLPPAKNSRLSLSIAYDGLKTKLILPIVLKKTG